MYVAKYVKLFLFLVFIV